MAISEADMTARVPLKRKTRLHSGGRLRPRRKTRKGTVKVTTLNTLWGQRIRERDKGCVMALWGYIPAGGCVGKLEAAHMYSKQAYPNVRWNLGNGNALCSKHHFFAHANPVQAGRFYEDRWGRAHLDSLWTLARAVGKIDRHAVKAYLLSGRAAAAPPRP